MSYSFSVRAPTRIEAKEQIAAEFAKVVQHNAQHAGRDAGPAEQAVCAFVDVLGDPGEGQVVAVSVSGSITRDPEAAATKAASLSLSAQLASAE